MQLKTPFTINLVQRRSCWDTLVQPTGLDLALVQYIDTQTTRSHVGEIEQPAKMETFETTKFTTTTDTPNAMRMSDLLMDLYDTHQFEPLFTLAAKFARGEYPLSDCEIVFRRVRKYAEEGNIPMLNKYVAGLIA